MTTQTLIFANFLAPSLYKTYLHITEYIERRLSIPAMLITGESLDDFSSGDIDGGFLCGLVYVHLTKLDPCPVELIAAPVLLGERYQHAPRYFSDIIVYKEAPYMSLADLCGCTWAYNEKASHSGYNLVYAGLLEQGLRAPTEYFKTMLESGSHTQSIQLVIEGKADAAAIDSHVLDFALQKNPRMASQLRIIGSFGPSTIPPFVVSTQLHTDLKQKMKEAFITMYRDAFYAQRLHEGLIERFVPVSDKDYDDIRAMYQSVQADICLRR